MVGLLFVLSQPRDGDEAEFHDWYDNEHGPARMALPGVHSGHRYRAIDGVRPGWLAWYDLDLGVLDTDAYRELRERRSARESAVMGRLAALDRRVYEPLDEHGSGGGPVLVVRSMSVRPGGEADFHAWYAGEHLPALHAIPGWGRTRRYVLRTGEAPHFLTLHEISGTQLFDTDAYRTATATPWRDRVMATLTTNERRLFTHHLTFGGTPCQPASKPSGPAN
ncbi:hypothetical protein DP939_27795 [Spongiactinospora rosea]|uniref:EthD domain-containing protein n=1 Tax=Spongiactinospora rosea TaxID=2248750 RepID=A0A366LUJ5_9ACTN|nr:hypothetical protein [Spongiactinospora rosea]RBQ16872.1 hypothetical protein DP939_27795 [Spongiactinospora rosea]